VEAALDQTCGPQARERVERRSNPMPTFTIAQRPPEADDPAVPGHWEGDLTLGAGGGSAGHWFTKGPTSAFTPKPTCAGSRTCSTADPDPP
jgi:hypothetical protein